MKKILICLLCVVFLVSAGLTGCGKKDMDDSSSAAGPSTDIAANEGTDKQQADTSVPGTFPLSIEKITLKFVAPIAPFIVDLDTNEFTKYMEEKTNVHIEWEAVPEAAERDKVKLILAGGDYPDVFFGCWQSIRPDVETQFGTEEKVFIPLNDLIDKNMVELKKVFKVHPDYRGAITSPDGNIYSLPQFEECYHCTLSAKMWINQPWLDKLGLKTPTTTDEFYDVLKAFKNDDPNGNNENDEIPLAGAVKGWKSSIDLFLINAFTFYDMSLNPDSSPTSNMGYQINNGKVETVLDKPEYKEALKYLNKLYKEGLIFEGTYTQDADQLVLLVENPSAETVGVVAGGYGGIFSKLGGERYKHYRAVAPLKGPQGVQNALTYLSEPQTGCFVITKECKYPDIAARWADWLYSREGTLMSRHGMKDKAWREPKEGEVGLDGRPATWFQLKPWSDTEPQNETYIRLGVYYESSDMRLGQAADPNIDLYSSEGLEKMLYEVSKNLYAPYAKPEKAMPTLRLLKDEQSEMASLQAEYAKYVKQAQVKFITGNLDIDKDWDKYVQDMERIGSSKLLEVYQKAYDRQYKK